MVFALLVSLALARSDNPVTQRAEALATYAVQHGGDARTAATVIRMHALRDDIDDLNVLVDPLATLASRRSTGDGVRALAHLFLTDIERARGRTVRATEVLKGLGFVHDWYVVGGFDNEGRSGCDTDFGPEASPDLGNAYPAKGRDVTWHTLTAHSGDGFVDLSASLRPASEVVGYGLTFLQVDAETRVTLGLGSSGGFRLFVNGSKVASSDRSNQPRMDQHRVQVTLRKGLNRVLFKVCHEAGPFGFFFRVERGSNGRGVTPVLPSKVPPLERGPSPSPSRQPTLSEVLAERVKSNPNDAALRVDAATVLSFTRAFEDKERTAQHEAEKAADAKPNDADIQLAAAAIPFDDGNVRRRLLERAVAAAPTSPWARTALAQFEVSREHPDVALRLASAVVKDAPSFAPAHVVLANALEALGMRVASAQAVETAFARLNFVPTVARAAIAQSRRLERMSEAMERSRMMLSLRYDDVDTRRWLASMLADEGNVAGALEQYRKVLALEPYDVQTLLRVAELSSANGRASESVEAFNAAEALAPDDADVFERRGRSQLFASQRDSALASFTTALRLKPQNAALKEVVRTLRGDDSNATPYAVPASVWSAPLDGPSADDAVILAEVTAVRVQVSGLASRFSQQVVKVLTTRGVEAFRQLAMTYSPDRQEVRVLKARVTKPDGSVLDSFQDTENAINEPWTGMYYDARARVLTFPALAPGDVLEVQWRIDDTAADNLLSDFFGDVDAVQSVFPKRRYQYLVDMPATRPLYWNALTLPSWLHGEVTTAGDRTTYRFFAENVAKVVPEPNMPGWAEMATPLHVSTYKTWDDVGRYWWGLVRDQLTPNDELRKTVDSVLKGVDRRDQAKVVAALYGFVVTNTRYVALEFGIHGYKPYRVDRVLSRRFGDCKDKAALLVAMLKVANVDARLVLLRMRHLGSLPAEPASLSAFNHAIAYVPSLQLYLDGTAEFHGSRELPTADRAANVLVVEPEGGSRFLSTPEATAADSVSTLTLGVTLKPDGSASVKGSTLTTGPGAAEVRRVYQTPATRSAVFEQQWAQSFPGVAVGEVSVSDVKQLEQPASVTFTMAVPRYAEAGAGTLRFFPFGASRTLTQALAPLTTRSWPATFSGPFTNRFRFTYTFPPGWRAPEVPPDVEELSPFGTLKLHVATEASGAMTVDGELTLTAVRVAPSEYPAFRAWLLKVDQAFGRKLVAQVGAPTADAREPRGR
ncbi:MAG: DUF3857 domain-containing protein [Archangium sp.]|nr:DUF3857 domain-containing protein [Archangium sp.]